MKKTLYYGLLMGAVLGTSPLSTTAQTLQELGRGDSLILNAPDGYKSYQWQVSSDMKNFTEVPNGKTQRLALKVFAPGYFRVRSVDENFKTVYLDTVQVKMTKINYSPRPSVSSGAHGFVETTDGTPGAGGISIPEDRDGAVAGTSKSLTKWTNGKSMAIHYFNHPQSTVDTDMIFNIKNGRNVSFRISVWDPSHMEAPMAENIVAVRGTGKPDTVRIVGLKFPKKAYYRYQLECLKGWNDIQEISKFIHYSPSRSITYKPGYLSSPSVHLSKWRSTAAGAPSGRGYDWCYQEVMMPKESDIPGTYVMSLGVLDGYMGIQMNGYSNGKPLHDVIFSMWDHGSVDEDPNLPDNLRANVVDYGPGVAPQRFANEGTGMKTFKSGYNWDCGTFVQFITNCRPEEATYTVIKNGKEEVIKQKNTLVSAWYNAQDGKGWQYMATLRLANKSIYFDSWYSFLENYNWPTGQALRRGFYRNGYGHAKDSKKWYHFNQINFGHTDGGNQVGARQDFGQGDCDEYENTFFMTTGGFIPSKVTSPKVSLNKENTPVDTINLDALLARVDQAVAHEKKMIEAKENFKNHKLDKTGWKVIKFSSEEASGEGSNGRAAQIIDGDEKTYWHSQWKGNVARYPHQFVIEMTEDHLVNGIQIITSNGGGNRHIKDCTISLSLDNSTWEVAYQGKGLRDQDVHQFVLDHAINARYIKLEITDGYTKEGFVRINEVDVTEQTNTGISGVVANGQFEVGSNQQELLVKVPAAAANAEISVYRTDGACLFNGAYPALIEGEVIRIPMLSAAKGIYVVSFKSDNVNVSKQVMWNK